jgi:hypothetical protein
LGIAVLQTHCCSQGQAVHCCGLLFACLQQSCLLYAYTCQYPGACR